MLERAQKTFKCSREDRIQWVLPVQQRPLLLTYRACASDFFYKKDFVSKEAVCQSPLSPNMIG